jgi:5-methyltetrahydrofolate--homocysteine methyltransferase
MIDSSKWEVIEAGLKCIQGKGIVNSISMKEGEAKFIEQAKLAAATAPRSSSWPSTRRARPTPSPARPRSAKRAYDLLLSIGFPAEDIIFDPNIFAIATGIPEHDNYAVDFIESVRWIKQHLPHAHISGGVSNVSFSFRGNDPCARRSTRSSYTTPSRPA